MVPFDPLVGEFRVHYAGFFDPGFGHSAEGTGNRAVLEVRSREVPFLLGHGQDHRAPDLCERLSEAPDRLYGSGLGSNYQGAERSSSAQLYSGFVRALELTAQRRRAVLSVNAAGAVRKAGPAAAQG